MTVRIGNIAFDCDDVLKMATFWSLDFRHLWGPHAGGRGECDGAVRPGGIDAVGWYLGQAATRRTA